MPYEFVALMVAFAPLFSKPVFQHVQVLLVGAILSPVLSQIFIALIGFRGLMRRVAQ